MLTLVPKTIAKLFSIYPENNIIGFPTETREMIFETVELVRKLKSIDVNAFTFTPYHGTVLRGLCERKKYVEKGKLAHIFIKDSMLAVP